MEHAAAGGGRARGRRGGGRGGARRQRCPTRRPSGGVAAALVRAVFLLHHRPALFLLGHLCLSSESRLRNRRGEMLRHGISTAAFAERAVVDQSQVVKIAADMPLDRACLLACGVITGLGAVTNTAQVTAGSSVVVIGTGGVGLNAVQGALLAGANPIIAIDIADSKLAAAREFGATHTLNAQSDDVRSAVRELTHGRKADYVLVTVGSPSAVTQGL